MNKINFLSYNLSDDRLYQEKTSILNVNFEWKSTETLTKVWIELLYKGETVVNAVCLKEDLTQSVNSTYKAKFELTPPFNVPDGIYEIRIGANEDCQDDCLIIGELQIGAPIKEIEPYNVIVTNTLIPNEIQKDIPFEVSADITFSNKISFPTSAYLSLWKDELLYDVIEGNINVTSDNKNVKFSTCLTNDLPIGEYQVKIGIHNVKTVSTETKIIFVVGTDTVRGKYHKPMSYGNYFVKSSGKEHFWYVNQFGAMIWDGEPYIPFGGMFVPKYLRQYDKNNPEVNKANFEQDKADLDELRAAGINDLYIGANIMLVTPTWAYKYFIDYLEKTGWKYGIQGDTKKSNYGSVYYPFATEKTSFLKVDNITNSGIVTLKRDTKFANFFNKEKNFVYIVVDNETEEMIDFGVSAMQVDSDNNIIMLADVKLQNNNNHTVYFAPEVYRRMGAGANYWDEPQKTYDYIETVFSRLETGDNFRFVVDLLNNESGIYNNLELGRFSDDQFNRIFADWLEDKYKSIDALNNAWITTPALLSFDEASKLIPVYTSPKDENNNSYSYCVNISNGAGYKADTHFGVLWNDYLDARDELYLEFMNKSSDTAKKHLNVPQIYKHVSVQRKYYINKNFVGGFDGLGSEAYESIETVTNQFAITSAQNNQFARTAWNLVTETNNHENVMGKYESGQWSYVSKEDMHLRFNKALELGMKGIFDFLLADRPDIGGKLGMAYSWIINKHVIQWAKEYKEYLHNPKTIRELVSRKYKDEVFYYYPPNKNWWAKVNERSCVLLTDDCYPFKRLKTEKEIHVLSTEDLSVDTRLIFINLNDAPYSKVYGPQLSDFINQNHDDKRICVLGHRNDMGTIPEIDKYYTTEKVSINNGTEVVQILKPTETSEILRTTSDGKPWALKDGNVYIVSTNSFETSTGDFGTLHYVDDLGITAIEF